VKDYYKILELSQDTSEDQIRKAYRSLALKHHPDRNPNDPGAEERFKEIAEAYGVLIDPAKRFQYDQVRNSQTQQRMAGGEFRYSQEQIFQDLFRDPRFSHIFKDLDREFKRAGIRFDRRFYDDTFFGGRGIFFGGIFFWGPIGSPGMQFRRYRPQTYVEKSHTRQPSSVFRRLGEKIGDFLYGGQKALSRQEEALQTRPKDIAYELTLNQEDAKQGSYVKISLDRGEGRETLKVRIPAGTRPGTRLRLKGKGIRKGKVSGDLYLAIHLTRQ
jgi:curved DNA-binding protein